MIEFLCYYGYIALKLAVGLIAFLLILRTTGRGSLSQMTPVDLVSNFVMGSIIGGVIYSSNVGIIQLLLVLFIWQTLIASLNFLARYSIFFRHLITGKNIGLVLDGVFQIDKIKNLGISVNDLITMLRIKGCSLYEAAFVHLETNGDCSVIKKEEGKRSVILVQNGEIVNNGLEEIGKSKTWLQAELKKKRVRVEDLFAVEWYERTDQNNKSYSGLFLVPFSKKV
ncbi:uncharacterized membrane protein YcaP (DUF421 family) [Bartonella doshiae]|uniref:Protein of uncharacterized function (DUF421) n=2 Tax=Bartonella doshiae TaxID=33044 RepID=A0A380ZCF2_BARDO|nr:YetF domain-containing protein [Bartonella doshiae]EJF81920.1 hypothetical protein MCS_00345 [Bartonella doshiae NCTC 12862 = ATCC 700133]MBB6159368.1 uncharacterized membrane protein YcaP (DUF421 family) [Bartonella doshiae]SUV44653.1 Protein of uncharacterised function (DUF421) [Bartonella doshiae]